MMTMVDDERAWPLRTRLLPVLGALAGLAIHALTYQVRPSATFGWSFTEDNRRLALATLIGVGAIVLAFAIERRRWRWAVPFAVVAGSVVAAVLYWNGTPDRSSDGGGWRLLCALLTVAIAAPLFQTARDASADWQRPALPYRLLHEHAWTNVVLFVASLAFLLVVWLLAWLLAALFDLVGLHLLSKLLERGWFGWMLSGTAFLGGVGLLREMDRIVATLQRVVMAVFAVLAPVLGAGLLIFLAALPFTGLAPLWSATKATTPILLGCVVAALLLANAVIGDGAEDERRALPLRWGAAALALAAFPLTLIAAVSAGLRIGQYGLTPQRLWGVVFVAVACAYGLAYLVALVRRRLDWARDARPANVRLAIGLCVVALLLSTPLAGFGAISARDQVARLSSGRTPAAKFDWAALAFDFGPVGRAAAARLAKGGATPAIRTAAAQALKATSRWDVTSISDREGQAAGERAARERPILVRPVAVPVPPDLRRAVFGAVRGNRFVVNMDVACDPDQPATCQLFWHPGDDVAVAVQDGCAGLAGDRGIVRACRVRTQIYRLVRGRWGQGGFDIDDAGLAKMTPAEERASLLAERAALNRGDVTIRTVPRRQLFIGDKPQGSSFR